MGGHGQTSGDLGGTLPPLPASDLAALRASIAAEGVKVPVVVDERGAIIDGRHRAMIAKDLGISYPTDVRSGLSDADKRVLAVTLNLDRRHLTDAQKVLIGRRIEPAMAERAQQRMRAGTAQDATLAANAAEVSSGRTEDDVAAVVGLGSGDTYLRGKRTLEEVERFARDLLPPIERGDLNLRSVRKELKARRDKHEGRSEWAAKEADEAIRVIKRLARVVAWVDPVDVGDRLGDTVRPHPEDVAEWLRTVYDFADYVSGKGEYTEPNLKFEAARRLVEDDIPF